jgi:ATP phosphoribosyltransferase
MLKLICESMPIDAEGVLNLSDTGATMLLESIKMQSTAITSGEVLCGMSESSTQRKLQMPTNTYQRVQQAIQV